MPESDIPTSRSGIEIAPGICVPPAALQFSFARSSGPGGQNVNKLETKAQLRVSLRVIENRIGAPATSRLLVLAGPSHLSTDGDLLITSEETRSQRMNKDACLKRLRSLLVSAIRVPRTRRATRPTRSSRERRLKQKSCRATTKRSRSSPRDDD